MHKMENIRIKKYIIILLIISDIKFKKKSTLNVFTSKRTCRHYGSAKKNKIKNFLNVKKKVLEQRLMMLFWQKVYFFIKTI